MSADPIGELQTTVGEAADALRAGDGGAAPPTLERPKQEEFGDYSTNAAMLLAPVLGEQPRGIAERLAGELEGRLGERLDRVEVAGPGFLNIFLSDGWYRDAMARALAGGGLEPVGEGGGVRILIEFVSANPTGPITAASGRHAAYGDSLARILAATGNQVSREYYVNDAGGQISRFAESIRAQMRGEDPPEDGYRGDYVKGLAERLGADGIAPDDSENEIAAPAVALMREAAEQTLRRFGVEFDTWSSESDFHAKGGPERALEDLEATGHVYESEGAKWLRTTDFGDDKDRVLVRSEGDPTYLLADVAYHRDKLARADLLIDVLGADHHGYIGRLKAAFEALGLDPQRLEAAIMQLVHVVEGGERAQMSKREGEFVSLDELIDDIGADAARFFMLQRSHDTTVDLDLELARRQSNDNPVYYVQYAHARIASILRKAGEDGESRAEAVDPRALTTPFEPAERALLKRLLELPREIAEAAERRAPHRLCAYATATAADFHAFYRDCQVVGAEGEGVEDARLALCLLTKRTIANTLETLGIGAPEQM